MAEQNSYQNELYVSTWASVLIEHTCSVEGLVNLSCDRALIALLANNHRVLRAVITEESLFSFESALLQKVGNADHTHVGVVGVVAGWLLALTVCAALRRQRL